MTLMNRFDRWDPFDELTTLRNRMDRLFTKFNDDVEQPLFTANWMPITDVFETTDALVVKTELPGIQEKDVSVEIENNVLTITGERKFEERAEEKGFQRFERKYGRFIRAFTLPPNVMPEKVAAHFANGLLEITIPKKEEAKPKKIKLELKKSLPVAA